MVSVIMYNYKQANMGSSSFGCFETEDNWTICTSFIYRMHLNVHKAHAIKNDKHSNHILGNC